MKLNRNLIETIMMLRVPILYSFTLPPGAMAVPEYSNNKPFLMLCVVGNGKQTVNSAVLATSPPALHMAESDIGSMDLYNNVRSYFIERVVQNSFPDGFCGKHRFRSLRALDIMSYTTIDSERYQLPADTSLQQMDTPAAVAEILGASDHELTILENLLPPHCKDAAGVRVLDVGCGYGGMARMIKLRYPKAEVIGVEFQPLVRDLARKLTACTAELNETDAVQFWEPNNDPNEHADIHAYLANAADQSIDAVLSLLAILHIPDKDKLFSELYRVLKPGGRVIFEDLIATAQPATIGSQLSCHGEEVRYGADVPKTLMQASTRSLLLESKLAKLERVVYFNDALTIDEYEGKLKSAGLEPTAPGGSMVCNATEVKINSCFRSGNVTDSCLNLLGLGEVC